jgi:COP9 signalosome complex subunit 7
MEVMDSESRSSSVALEQFLILSKSAKGLSAVELIRQVIESPSIYVFGELLDMPNIKELANNSEYEPYYRLLNVFAFGTYSDYLSNIQLLPQLTDSMKTKLRHLTIVSLATKRKHIPYQLLLNELDIKNLRQLEDLIIEVIYANVVSGKMDQMNNRLEIDHTIGRDIKHEDLKTVTNVLNEWCRNCDNVLRNIELQITNANTLKDDNNRLKQSIETQVNNIKKTIKTQDMDDPMSTDVVNSSPRDPRDVNFEKMKRNAGKNKGLRGSGGKFWRRDN